MLVSNSDLHVRRAFSSDPCHVPPTLSLCGSSVIHFSPQPLSSPNHPPPHLRYTMNCRGSTDSHTTNSCVSPRRRRRVAVADRMIWSQERSRPTKESRHLGELRHYFTTVMVVKPTSPPLKRLYFDYVRQIG